MHVDPKMHCDSRVLEGGREKSGNNLFAQGSLAAGGSVAPGPSASPSPRSQGAEEWGWEAGVVLLAIRGSSRQPAPKLGKGPDLRKTQHPDPVPMLEVD